MQLAGLSRFGAISSVDCKKECQDVADQQAFAKGDPEHLVLAQTKALSDPLDVRFMPKQDRAGLLRFLRLLGLLCHD